MGLIDTFAKMPTPMKAALAAPALLLAFPVAAQSQQEAQIEQVSVNTNICVEPAQQVSVSDVRELSNSCDAVIYYGDNISNDRIQSEVRVLRNSKGLDVIAVKGFSQEDSIAVLSNRRIIGGRVFSEADLYDGQVGAMILREVAPQRAEVTRESAPTLALADQ